MKRIQVQNNSVPASSNRINGVKFRHGKAASQKTASHIKARELQLECLEERALLSASPVGDYTDVAAAYTDFQITAESNLIDVTELTADSLRAAIQQASQTTADDVLVVHTTAAQNTIALDGSALVFDVDSDLYGSITLVGYGDTMLTLTNTQENIALVISGDVNFGGISFLALESEGQAFTTDNLVVVSDAADVDFSRSLWAVEDLAGVPVTSLSSSEGGISGSSDESLAGSSVSTHSYDTTVNISGTKWAYVTGLSQADYNQLQTWTYTGTISGDFIDAEKGSDLPDCSEHCWSATASNILWYTRWANAQLKDANGKSLFSNEDTVFSYFLDHFTNEPGAPYYAFQWFTSGQYDKAGSEGWAQIKEVGGGFYSSVSTSDAYAYKSLEGSSVSNFDSLVSNLKSDYGIGITLGSYDQQGKRTGGHIVTVWGYIYDTAYATTDRAYYQSLLISDSDNNKNDAASGPNAIDTLTSVSLTWDATDNMYNLANYSSGQFNVEGYTYLAPLENYVNTVQVSTADGGSLSSAKVPHGDTVTLSNIPVNSVGYDAVSSYKVNVYASTDTSITSDDILLATIDAKDLAAGASASLSASIDTNKLSASTSYYIGWILDVPGNDESMTITGNCTTQLQVLADRPAAPTLADAQSTSFNSLDITLTGVEGISDYILYYSTSPTFDSAKDMHVSAGKTSLTGLSIGTYYFRAVSVLTEEVVSLYSNTLVGSTYTKGVRTENSGSLSTTRVPKGDTFTISNVTVENFGTDNTGSYTIRYYASTDTTIDPSSDILLGEESMSNLAGGSTKYASATLSTSSLETDRSYYIGWVVDVTGNKSTETTAYCETQLTTLSSRPAAPTLSATATAIDKIEVTLSSSETGVTYRLEYSTSSSFTDAKVIDNAQVGVNEVTGLKTGTKYYFRAMAILTEEVTSRYSDTCDATTFLLSVSTQNGCKFSATSVKYGADFTISEITVINDGQVDAENFQIKVFAAPAVSDIPSGTLVGTITVDQLKAGATTTVQLTVDSSVLDSGMQYYFGWFLMLENNWSSSTKGVNASDTVMVNGTMLDIPILDLCQDEGAVGSTSVKLDMTEVENGKQYVIEYATNSDFTDIGTMYTEQTGIVTVTGLNAETTYYFRAKAKGYGAYEDSYYSSVIVATTGIVPFDLATYNGGKLPVTEVLHGESFGIEQVIVENLSNTPSSECKVTFYASLDKTLDKETDIQMGIETVEPLDAYGKVINVSCGMDSSKLEVGKSYYIFWELSAASELNPDNNIGYCDTSVTIQALSLESFTLKDPKEAYLVYDLVKTNLEPSTATVTYQWYRGSSPDNITTAISGATKSSYQIMRADVGSYLKCVVTGTGSYAGNSLTVTVPNKIDPVNEFDLGTTADTEKQILSTNAVTYGESFTVSNVPIFNDGNIKSSTYTIRYYASKDTNITTADILLGEYTMPALEAGASTVDVSHTFSSEELTSGVTYRIGWLITASEEEHNTDNNSAIAGVLAVNKLPIDTPELSLAYTGAKSIKLYLSEVDHAAQYVIQYSTSPNFTKYTSYTAKAGYNTISLAASTQYYFRAYAVGETNYATSEYSEVLAAATKMYVPDLTSLTTATLVADSPLVPGSNFTVQDLSISNIGNREAETYTITFYAATENIFVEETPDVSKAILLDTIEKGELYSLPATGTIKLSQTLGSELLDYETTYYIGWYLETDYEVNTSNNWGYCDGTLTTSKLQILKLDPVIVTEKSALDSVVVPTNCESIDEWTSFGLEFWSDNGMGNSVWSVTYDSTLFTLNSLDAAKDFHVTKVSSTESENLVKVTLTAVPENNTVGDGQNVLAARLNFVPVGNGGVEATLENMSGVSNWCSVNGTYLSTVVKPYLYDLDDNGVVNLNDLMTFSTMFNTSVSETPQAALVDYDSNGVVNLNDLLLFASHYQTSVNSGNSGSAASSSLKLATTSMVPLQTTAVAMAMPVQTEKKELDKYDSYESKTAVAAENAVSAVFSEELDDEFDLLNSSAGTETPALATNMNDFWGIYGSDEDDDWR